jgi:polyhydroxyalkanoate synthase
MADADLARPSLPTLDQMQRWTQVIGQAQQMILEKAAQTIANADQAAPSAAFVSPFDPQKVAEIQADFAGQGAALWQRFLDGAPAPDTGLRKDRRFSDPAWSSHPFFDFIHQSYLLVSDYLLRLADAAQGVDDRTRERIRFATRGLVDALSPSNFPLTNPQVIEKTMETGGENLLTGLGRILADMEKGQLTHTDGTKFELGRNIAATPGKVVWETPLYQLIQYTPTTEDVHETPVVIFPPWINRFYILDLAPEKSFVRWAVGQGLTVFMVSWKSADESMKEVIWDDYVLGGQIDAIDTVRDLLDVESVHAIGYCVAGTTLAATLALLAARGEADKVASATFFTAQVDFSKAGDLGLFVDDGQLKLVEQLAAPGYLDGRYMAATFNLLRGRDLIWSYVVDNYLLGREYAPFDLLYWNGDTTNLPARWHHSYLSDLYRDNRLVVPGGISIDGTPIDLRRVTTPSYIQAGREDHIAPAESVWKLTEHFSGPTQFVLAGSGHIAGVVNPPASGKYQYWTSAAPASTLAAFIEGARETKGSWWPDWCEWIAGRSPATVKAKGARKPGKGKLKAIEDAPGRYVSLR